MNTKFETLKQVTTEQVVFRGVARIVLKGVLNLVSLTSPFLQLIRCIVLTSLATLSAFSLETCSHNYSELFSGK